MNESKYYNFTKLMQTYTSITETVNQYYISYAKSYYKGSTSKITFWDKLQACL